MIANRGNTHDALVSLYLNDDFPSTSASIGPIPPRRLPNMFESRPFFREVDRFEPSKGLRREKRPPTMADKRRSPARAGNHTPEEYESGSNIPGMRFAHWVKRSTR
jgi:hypothetical protein